MGRRKIHSKFYGNKSGEITEHIDARGGEYPFRWDSWKAIKECESTEEINQLIAKFKSDIRDVETWSDETIEDRNKKFQRIRDLRTCITMANDYEPYIRAEVDDAKFESVSPNTNTGKKNIERDAVRLDVTGYIQHGKTVGHIPRDDEYQQRVLDIQERNLRNQRIELLSKPDLKKIYKKWFYHKEINK